MTDRTSKGPDPVWLRVDVDEADRQPRPDRRLTPSSALGGDGRQVDDGVQLAVSQLAGDAVHPGGGDLRAPLLERGRADGAREFVGQRNLAVTANTYTHVLVSEAELDYAELLR